MEMRHSINLLPVRLYINIPMSLTKSLNPANQSIIAIYRSEDRLRHAGYLRSGDSRH